MAFTYTDLTSDRDKVRFNIGDTVESSGPRPDKRNFSDTEISHILDREDDVIVAATGYAFEVLAAEWSAYAMSEREGEVSMDAKNVADTYRQRATEWRSKPGGGDNSQTIQAGVIGLDFTEKDD